LQVDAWKKKLDEVYSFEERSQKILSMIGSISVLPKYCSIVLHEGCKVPHKQAVFLYLYDFCKSDILQIKNGILEHIDWKKRDIEKNEKIKQNPKGYQAILDDFNAQNEKMNKKWKTFVKIVPLEIHVELAKIAYDLKLFKEFLDLMETLVTRIKYRRIEQPYIAEIEVQASVLQYANIPNKYEKIEVDLNINSYKRGIRKLREQGKYIASKDQPVEVTKVPSSNRNNKKVIEEAPEDPYEKIEGLDHSFVYLLLRRTHNPDKAIVDYRIEYSNDKQISKLLKANERALVLPITTFEDNLYEEDKTESMDVNKKVKYEENKLMPYLIYRKTMNGLADEGDRFNVLIDIQPIVSNTPFGEPAFGYKKDSKEITLINQNKNNENFDKPVYNFNHNYINMTHKTDESYFIVEREYEILKHLYELEMTHGQIGNNNFKEGVEENTNNTNTIINVNNQTTNSKILGSAANNSKMMGTNDIANTPNGSSDKFIGLNFQLKKFEALTNVLFNSIKGNYIGPHFLTLRRNFIYDICIYLWNKYLKDLFARIDYFNQISHELEKSEQEKISSRIAEMGTFLYFSLFNIHSVLNSFTDKDPIILSYITIRLADLAYNNISRENLSPALTNIAKSLEYLNKYKEKENTYGLNNYENKHTYTSFTCDNNKITTLYKYVEDSYETYVRELNFKHRKGFRKANGLRKMLPEEELEEDFEYTYLEKEYRDKVGLNATVNPTSDKGNINILITEYENTLNCLIVDINLKYNLLYLNNMENEEHVLKPGVTVKLPTKTLKKLDIITGPSAQKVRESLSYLKSNLQEAGKIEPDKPVLLRKEKQMFKKISKNFYIHILFQISMAENKESKQDQKFILNQALGNLNKIKSDEDEKMNYFKKYFFHIKTFEKFNKNTGTNAMVSYPNSLLFNPILIENLEKMPEPILIHKTQHTASFIFPLIK
jgi:hypothetical protein